MLADYCCGVSLLVVTQKLNATGHKNRKGENSPMLIFFKRVELLLLPLAAACKMCVVL